MDNKVLTPEILDILIDLVEKRGTLEEKFKSITNSAHKISTPIIIVINLFIILIASFSNSSFVGFEVLLAIAINLLAFNIVAKILVLRAHAITAIDEIERITNGKSSAEIKEMIKEELGEEVLKEDLKVFM